MDFRSQPQSEPSPWGVDVRGLATSLPLDKRNFRGARYGGSGDMGGIQLGAISQLSQAANGGILRIKLALPSPCAAPMRVAPAPRPPGIQCRGVGD